MTWEDADMGRLKPSCSGQGLSPGRQREIKALRKERYSHWGGWGLLCLRGTKSRVRRTYTTLLNTRLCRVGLLVWWHIKSIFLEEQGCWICSWMAFLPRAELAFQVRLWIWAKICCHQPASCYRAELRGPWHCCELTPSDSKEWSQPHLEPSPLPAP